MDPLYFPQFWGDGVTGCIRNGSGDKWKVPPNFQGIGESGNGFREHLEGTPKVPGEGGTGTRNKY